MIKAITGTRDLLYPETLKWKYLEDTVSRVFNNFNYKEIRTPVFEETSLFARGIGEETDIVGKEMYTFLDRSETSVTLKPEMTAAVVRAFIEHSLGKQQSLSKFFYISPMFRQERPQAGRLRQFHQFGAEAIGSASPMLDVEMIQMVYDILSSLGLSDLKVKINSLGIPESRESYKKKLREYLKDKKSKLSEDSRNRFDRNIMRIFDSKVESDQEILKEAPLLLEHLDKESVEEFDMVKKLLHSANISFEVEPRLVRGLDYYTRTTFEIDSEHVGAQSALCGGGRYDLLIEQLGGSPTPGVGFAAGIERILLACEKQNTLKIPGDKLDLYIVKFNDEMSPEVFEIGVNLRRANLSVDFDYLNRSVKAQMREANKMNTRYVLFVGGEEFEKKQANLKNMNTGEQQLINVQDMETLVKLIKRTEGEG